MLHSESQISIKPLCLNMLFPHVYYIFMICFMEFLSLIVWFQSRSSSSNCIRIVTSLLSYCSEDVILFQEVTQVLGLKEWLESRGCWHNIVQNIPQTLACMPVRVSSAPSMLACPQHESIHRSSGSRSQWDVGVGQQKG